MFFMLLLIPSVRFPPILVEVQNKVDEKFLTRAIQYCTLTFERYNRLPIIVIFGIANATVFLMSKSEDSDFPFARQIQSIGWAERCLLLTSSTLQANQQEETLHPLQAVGYFLCSQFLSTNTLDYGKNDSFIKLLYTIAQANLDQTMGEETEKLEAVVVIDTMDIMEKHPKFKCYYLVMDNTHQHINQKPLNCLLLNVITTVFISRRTLQN
ncbi:MAG: hypothetical protein EXX96DRAFT_616733 [Benjaminiella poitrasii]|nr:MAG: hypothetical protein EXX96DRAFT_616733 [Benjaminiella poitrasii]